ncbi:putative selenate reductase subunit YgfK [Enterobacteriaceae bacterium H11S18]|uniref:putative selenate reductase subunit YgfK n=1 Tax=Dryocola clanedunensis TaxID=2925396 RepID=UPI0022F0F880|nr:putative selenate reductase subunit YgfK [Dryocola clanedunensis]MCT4713340.1 putative selenate reductase subunit YgfK [Dryocola clanedunensis]
MSDIMRPIPFSELLHRMFAEYAANRSIFGIPETEFYLRDPSRQLTIFGETCDTPVGPAAGPHTQLAQNIITSWLTGGSFIELKTVQILDRLELEKPCIDAEDEAFNTEWSTEFTLLKAWDEYTKAWFALWLLEEIFTPRHQQAGRSFIFNMSVGYNLEGITQPPMQKFIDEMMDASGNAKFALYREELKAWVSSEAFISPMGLQSRRNDFIALPERIPSTMVKGVTLSTMHGCPPEEIESICSYMLTEKKLHTFVKLNPTLLGYTRVREILDGCGFDYIGLKEASFDHDLKLETALEMLQRLMAQGKAVGREFGVKLTNTLGAINHKGRLPGEEMYMSGRALYPLSINVAATLSRAFEGRLPISYSGGASQFNIVDIFATGIHPITMATDLLKPGGYLRLSQCAGLLSTADGWQQKTVNVAKLEQLASEALTVNWAQKEWKSKESIDAGGPLPLTNCYVAPCVTACAIKQDIPEYLRLAGEGRYVDALELIYQRNALPAITGHICDHQCQYNCTRLDYENSLNIRAIKDLVVSKGSAEYRKRWLKPAGSGSKHPVAVIGAGPAGLAAGYFLARAGHPVTLFEREDNAGGVVRNIVPQFRIPAEKIVHDIDFVAEHGVKFVFSCDPLLTADKLRQQGFHYVCIGIGADSNSGMALAGNNRNVHKSFEFLRAFNCGEAVNLGRHVAIIGAGNTAMDCARAALRVPGVETATIVYRRSRNEMPAWPEEVKEAVHDGVQFHFLASPERFDNGGQLLVREMKLGEADAKGRRRPVATDRTETLPVDALISAIGESPDYDLLARMGVPLNEKGFPELDSQTLETTASGVFLIGDVQSGPSSIVAAIAGARKATDAILARENIRTDKGDKRWLNNDPVATYARKGRIAIRQTGAEAGDDFARQEAQRCLECNYVCAKCVDVCPNRANISLAVPGFKDRFQTLHLDAYCNECGNCAQFCPWQGKPYKDKLTVFSLEHDFFNSTNPGFLWRHDECLVRHEGAVWKLPVAADGALDNAPEGLTEVCSIINYVKNHHDYLLGAVEE